MINKKNLYSKLAKVFGKNLTKLIIENKLSLKEIASPLNVSIQSISQYTKGELLPSVVNIYMLCIYFNVPMSYFLPVEPSSPTIDEEYL